MLDMAFKSGLWCRGWHIQNVGWTFFQSRLHRVQIAKIMLPEWQFHMSRAHGQENIYCHYIEFCRPLLYSMTPMDFIPPILGTHFTDRIWAHTPNLAKLHLALCKKYISNQVIIFHMSQQLNSCDKCKIMAWLHNQEQNQKNNNFHSVCS